MSNPPIQSLTCQPLVTAFVSSMKFYEEFLQAVDKHNLQFIKDHRDAMTKVRVYVSISSWMHIIVVLIYFFGG